MISNKTTFRIKNTSVEKLDTISSRQIKRINSKLAVKPFTHWEAKKKIDCHKNNSRIRESHNQMSNYIKDNMLSKSIPKICLVDCSISHETKVPKKRQELMKKDALKLIEHLKNSKNNESDLNGKLNIKFKRLHGKKQSLTGGDDDIKEAMNSIRFNKPKLKRVQSVVNGSVSYLINTKKEKLSVVKNRKEEFDEYFDFSRKNLDNRFMNNKYSENNEKKHVRDTSEDSKKDEDNSNPAVNSDNKLRLRTVAYLLENNTSLVHKFKLNYKILNKWIGYVGYLSKNEFEYAISSIGVPYDKKLYDKLFWLFDINKDGIVDAKEFGVINNLFISHSLEEKVTAFFEIVDMDGEGFLDEDKIKTFYKKRYIKPQSQNKEIYKEEIAKKVEGLIQMIGPQKKSDIKFEDVISAAKSSS